MGQNRRGVVLRQAAPARIRFAVGVALLLGLASALAQADSETFEPFQGVRYVRRIDTEPQPMAAHVLQIGLAAPGIHFSATEPNGDGPRETWTETTRDFVARTGAQIGVNANFFEYDHKKDTDLKGLAYAKGALVSPWDRGGYSHGLNISEDNRVAFIRPDPALSSMTATEPPVPLYNAVTGDRHLVREGRITVEPGGERHPRTAIGVDAENRLLLAVVDGRRPGYSTGMTFHELAGLLLEFGAVEAIALDGGGSTTLVFADPEPRVVNAPPSLPLAPVVDGKLPTIERPVGNNIGVYALPAAAKDPGGPQQE